MSILQDATHALIGSLDDESWIDNDENEPYNDENAPAQAAAVPVLPLPTPRSASAARNASVSSSAQRRSRRSTLSNVLQPAEDDVRARRDRERTPPMSARPAVDVFGTPVGQTFPELARNASAQVGEDYEAESLLGEEERRKRRRISDVE